MSVRAERYSLLLPQLFSSFPSNFCPLLTHDSGHVQTQFIEEDLAIYLKDKYPSAGGKLTFTALERVPGLFSHMLAYPNISAILLCTRMYPKPEASEMCVHVRVCVCVCF